MTKFNLGKKKFKLYKEDGVLRLKQVHEKPYKRVIMGNKGIKNIGFVKGE
jgi:hypothetical protein